MPMLTLTSLRRAQLLSSTSRRALFFAIPAFTPAELLRILVGARG
jgi:hypothetical protein